MRQQARIRQARTPRLLRLSFLLSFSILFLSPLARLSGQVFDPPAGNYMDSLVVRIDALPMAAREDVEVRCTSDGSEPTVESRLYTDPVPVATNSVLRAAGFVSGRRATPVVSSSYFLGVAHALPVVSLSIDPGDYRAVHNNAQGRGREWERVAFMEYFEGGRRRVATGLGLRLHGGAGRAGGFETKKAYRLYFRGVYGAKKLEYPIIPGAGVEVFDRLVLRSGFNDSFHTNGGATYIRDELIRRLHRDMGGLTAHGAWCVLYVNMKFRGIYNIVERIDDDFLSSHRSGRDWDVIKTRNEVQDGSRDEWDRLRDFAVERDLGSDAVYTQFLEMIDVENFTSYMILNLWGQNHDWPNNNWYAVRERAPGAKWMFLSWDGESALGLNPPGHDVDSFEFVLGQGGYVSEIFQSLLDNARYRDFFLQQFERHTTGVLDSRHVAAHIGRLAMELETDIEDELVLYGWGRDEWLFNVVTMVQFAENRGDVVLELVRGSSRYAFRSAREVAFRRGDANGDGLVDVADAVTVLGNLLHGDDTLECFAAADVDATGDLNLADGIGILGYLFLGGATPPEPFVDCGFAPTANSLPCEGGSGCR